MSIKVACKSCGWKGSVDDSIAGEVIACRACAEPLFVRMETADEARDFELIDGSGSKPALPVEPARKRVREKRKPTVLPPERQRQLSLRHVTILGGVVFFAGCASLIVDTILAQYHIYPFILLGVGSMAACTGYMLDRGSK